MDFLSNYGFVVVAVIAAVLLVAMAVRGSRPAKHLTVFEDESEDKE